jgi:two-component system, cell cycle response regulator DivK
LPEGTTVTARSQEGTPLVLIVDDNEKNRRLTRDVLGAAGFRTIEAATGAEGIALADEHLPDVILMDMRLPDMDGAAAARGLAEHARTTQIPVVALSSVPIDRHDETRTDVFAGYLGKPFSVRDFPAQVRHFCAKA